MYLKIVCSNFVPVRDQAIYPICTLSGHLSYINVLNQYDGFPMRPSEYINP